MKIYTKGGDKGETSLWGGKRVSKAAPAIEAYGTLDELNVHIGLLRDVLGDMSETVTLLADIQQQLFSFGAHLAADPAKKGLKLPHLDNRSVAALEQAIDAMENDLPALKNFILPGGHVHVSYCHLARVVCRRAERLVVALQQQQTVQPLIISYLNRLSDYLFVLSRWVGKKRGAKELPWQP